jgi:hypothetical protein
MPFTFTGLATKVKDNPFGFEDCNIIRNDALYLKQQSEVLVAQDGTTLKPDVLTEASLIISNAPFQDAALTYQSSAMKWGNSSLDDPFYWLSF